jgi:hypothetical protein
MQSDPKEIYQITATRTGKKEQLYRDIGNFVFRETQALIKKPKSLITKLKGLGFWYLRKSRMEKLLAHYPPYYDIEGYQDFDSEKALLYFMGKKELYDILKARLQDYQAYLAEKQKVNQRKHEFNQVSKGS